MNEHTVNNRNKTMRILPWLLLVFVTAAALLGVNYYKGKADEDRTTSTQNQLQEVETRASETSVDEAENKAETDRVLAALRKVLYISETSEPTVARVVDPDELKASNKTFYQDLAVGDYIVIFPKRAIIYRESANQIINVAPIINTADP